MPILSAHLLLTACDRNKDTNNGEILAVQGANDGSLDASTMDALTNAHEPAMDVTAALAAEENAKAAAPASTPATANDAR